MALYISAGRRRRTAIVAAIVALIVGLAAGFGIGRGTATGIDETVAAGRAAGRDFASSLRVLPLEYEQMASGSDGSTAGAADIIRRSLAAEPKALAAAPWLSDTDIAALDAKLDVLRDAPATNLSPDDFSKAVDEAAAEVERRFGVASTSSPG